MKHYRTLVLSGGGIRDTAILGALHYYDERDMLSDVKNYYGASAGGVVCLLMACGYKPMEIFKEVYTANIFGTGKINLLNIFSTYGLRSIDPLISKIEDMLRSIGENPYLTFNDLYRKDIRLVINAVNISTLRVEYFSHDLNGNMRCIDAIRLSCNFPLIFEKAVYNDCIYIDGGCIDNFPIRKAIDDNMDGDILGISLKDKITEGTKSTLGFLEYIYNIVTMPISILTDIRCSTCFDKADIVLVVINGNSILGTDLSQEDKMNLFMLGYAQSEREHNLVVIKEF